MIFLETFEAHTAQHVGRLRELNRGVVNQFDAIAPGVEKILKRTGQQRNSHLLELVEDRLAIVDHQTEMAFVVGRLAPASGKVQELIAEIDKCHRIATAAQLEIEPGAVKFERLVDITHFEGNMVNTNRAGFSWFRHNFLPRSQATA